MKIRTNEKTVDLEWVRCELSLCMLDEHNDTEMLTVTDTNDRTIFVCSFASIKRAASIARTVQRVGNDINLRDSFKITAYS